jgi:hypothetical protein
MMRLRARIVRGIARLPVRTARTANAIMRHLVARSWPIEYLPARLLPDLYNYRIFEIPPSFVNRKLGSHPSDRAGIVAASQLIAKAARAQFLLSGDWDLCYHKLDIPGVVEEYCGRRLPMEATHRYRSFMKFMEHGQYELARDCRTQEDLSLYFQRIRRLHRRIQEKGYRRGSWIKGETGPEIEIAVGRDGGLYMLGNGNHRLAVAKLLKLQSVPVHVRAVHPYFLVGPTAKSQAVTPKAIDEALTRHMRSLGRGGDMSDSIHEPTDTSVTPRSESPPTPSHPRP